METEADRRAGVLPKGVHLYPNLLYESRMLFFLLEKISRALEEDGNLSFYVVNSQLYINFVQIQ